MREFLRLEAGDKLDFIITDDGEVLLRPVSRDLRELHGSLHEPELTLTPRTVDEMNTAIRERFGHP